MNESFDTCPSHPTIIYSFNSSCGSFGAGTGKGKFWNEKFTFIPKRPP